MKEISFYKYQGTGNDFVMIDQRDNQFLNRNDTQIIQSLCDRKFGIGADGLILLQNLDGYDFEMVYFNADGKESTMCGNGGRCIVAFAKFLGIINSTCNFMAIDGAHIAEINNKGIVSLKMSDVNNIEIGEDYFVLNTGSPHYVIFVEDLTDINVVESGEVIRYNDRFRKEGINVNFVERVMDGIEVATYERGVEDETLSCGTGVTAAAIAWHLSQGKMIGSEIAVKTKGGDLKVKLEPGSDNYHNIWLCGPAVNVFKGTIQINK